MAGRAVYGRNPQRVQAIFANRVADGFAVRGVSDLAASARIALDYFHGLQSFEIQNFYDDRTASGGLRLKCESLSVARNIYAAAGEQRLGELCGRASIHGNFFSHKFSGIESSVDKPFSVGRTHGRLVVRAGGDLFQIASGGVRAPYIQGIATAARCGTENNVASVIAGDGPEGREIVAQKRDATAAVGVHLEDAVFLLGEDFSIRSPAKPTGRRTTANRDRLSRTTCFIGRGEERSDVLRLHGGDGLAVSSEADHRIGIGVAGDGPVQAFGIGNNSDLIAIEIRFAAAGYHDDTALIGKPDG